MLDWLQHFGDSTIRKWALGVVVTAVYIGLAAFWALRTYRKRKAGQLEEMANLERLLSSQGRHPLGGKTDRYEWTQNESEVDVLVPVADGTRAKDVICAISRTQLKLKVHGEWVIKGDLYRDVDTGDCTWQIEKEKSRTVVWVSMTKANKADKEQWRGVIKADVAESSSSTGPPIFPVDPNDPGAMERISEFLKKSS